MIEKGRRRARPAQVPRKHCKLPKAAAGGRAGLEALGKVAYDAKRDRWHGYDAAAVHADTMTRSGRRADVTPTNRGGAAAAT